MRAFAFIAVFFILASGISFAQKGECDYRIDILINSSEFTTLNFEWRMKATKISGDTANITGTARIEDSSGKIIRNYKPWNSEQISRQKTSSAYSPNLNEGQYAIISEINVDCIDVDKSNNENSKNFIIKNSVSENPQPGPSNKGPIQNDTHQIKNNSCLCRHCEINHPDRGT